MNNTASLKREMRILSALVLRVKRQYAPRIAEWWWNAAFMLFVIAIASGNIALVLAAMVHAGAATQYRSKIEYDRSKIEHENNKS